MIVKCTWDSEPEVQSLYSRVLKYVPLKSMSCFIVNYFGPYVLSLAEMELFFAIAFIVLCFVLVAVKVLVTR